MPGNELRVLPSDLGWLTGLTQLNVTDNELLHLPAHVMALGLGAVLAYLQVCVFCDRV